MSAGPPAKIARIGNDFPQIDQNGNGKAIEFVVILCGDVLLEVLCWGDRRRLTKLERIGRRLHWSVVKFFSEMPFLRLNFELTTTTWNRCQCYIFGNERKQIFKYQLDNSPQFLRFDRVELKYQRSIYEYAPPIEKKCQSVVNYLQHLKLNNSSLVHFNGIINKNSRAEFSDYSQLLDHLRNELLPICGLSRGFKFEIDFFSDEVSHTDLIAQILQLPQIGCCSNVEIKLRFAMHPILMQLPIEPISNWLHRNCDGTKEKSKERSLRICPSNSFWAQKLCDHLKEAFVEAKVRVCPFTLMLDYGARIITSDNEEKEIMINKNTGEELSIVKKIDMGFLYEYLIIIIKRGALKKN